jgi:hypothetical protein
MKRANVLPALLILVVSAALVGAPLAQDTEEARGVEPNVQITLAVGDVDDPAPERVYRVVGQAGSATHRMLTGWRMPIPTHKAPDGDEAESEVTAFVYQNVGVTANLKVWMLSADRIRLEGQIELSGANDKMDAASEAQMPVIATFQQELRVVLKAGQPLKVAEVTDPEGRSLFLQLQVDVLD